MDICVKIWLNYGLRLQPLDPSVDFVLRPSRSWNTGFNALDSKVLLTDGRMDRELILPFRCLDICWYKFDWSWNLRIMWQANYANYVACAIGGWTAFEMTMTGLIYFGHRFRYGNQWYCVSKRTSSTNWVGALMLLLLPDLLLLLLILLLILLLLLLLLLLQHCCCWCYYNHYYNHHKSGCFVNKWFSICHSHHSVFVFSSFIFQF